MERVVAAEWLDEMAVAEAGAICSRRDLQRLNILMGHAAIMRRALDGKFVGGRPVRVMELGTGDGTFMLRLAKALAPQWPETRVTLVDRRPSVSERTRAGFEALGWHVDVIETDVFDWLEDATAVDVIAANLFLHHFDTERLRQLLALAAKRCGVFVACEPRRATPALLMSRLLWLMGCHPVTRHDAVISVRAGFRGREISSQWPASGWSLREECAGAFGHLFAASKKSSA